MRYIESVDQNELAELHQRFGHAPKLPINLVAGNPFLTGRGQLLTSDRRRAEICYVMHRGTPRDGILFHRKIFYPEAAYRLPTGGIHQGESVLGTLAREIKEETDFNLQLDNAASPPEKQVTIERFLGTIVYQIEQTDQGRMHSFATYHFLVKGPTNHEPVTLDPDEHIAGWRWQPSTDLMQTASILHSIGQGSPDWADWGRFRATSHRFVAKQLG